MNAPPESITEFLERRLRDVGPRQWETIAEASGVTVSFIRKFVYGSRPNPRVQTVQPLLDYFRALDDARLARDIDSASPNQAELFANSDGEGAAGHDVTLTAAAPAVHHHAGVGR